MSFVKRNYVDGETVITASNLNDIQDAVIDLEATRNVPTNVRTAIYTLLENAAYATTGLEDEIAIVEEWAAEITSLTLSAFTLSLNQDIPQTLTATTIPSGITVAWTSSDSSVATVSDGVVTGVSNGSCTITASAGDLSATCDVTVSGFAELESISAVYTQSGTVYDTDSLDSLKADLVVTATYSDSSTATIASADYTLSGTLTEGTSTITVAYSGKTTTFTVTVTHIAQDTTAEIEKSGKYITYTSSAGYFNKTSANAGTTIKYAVVNAPSNKLHLAGIIPTDALSNKTLNKDTNPACAVLYDANGEKFTGGYVTEQSASSYNRWVQNVNGSMTEYNQSWEIASGYYYITFSVDMRYLDDAYIYDGTTGQVFFAGINTPYYGMTNISEANA